MCPFRGGDAGLRHPLSLFTWYAAASRFRHIFPVPSFPDYIIPPFSAQQKRRREAHSRDFCLFLSFFGKRHLDAGSFLYVQRPTGRPSRWAEDTIHCDGFTRRRRFFYNSVFYFSHTSHLKHRNNRIVRFSTLYTTAWIRKGWSWDGRGHLGGYTARSVIGLDGPRDSWPWTGWTLGC